MTDREKRLAKADRLEGWAEKRAEKADADLAAARRMGDAIPFGQPMMPDHYSYGRDRRYRDRMGRTYDRAFESSAMADRMASRAAGIRDQADGAIYSDDEDAVEQLEAKIARLEAQRDERKAANVAYRKEHKAELKAMTAYGRSQAVPYSVTNLTATIATTKKRLVDVKRQQARAAAAEAAEGGVVVADSAWAGYVTVTFAEKPDRETITALKAAGFYWNQGSWRGETDRLPAEVAAMREES